MDCFKHPDLTTFLYEMRSISIPYEIMEIEKFSNAEKNCG
jgi:hypothetical protein